MSDTKNDRLEHAEIQAKNGETLRGYKELISAFERDYREMEAICDQILAEFGDILPDDIGVQVAKRLSAELKSSADYIEAFLQGDFDKAALIRKATS